MKCVLLQVKARSYLESVIALHDWLIAVDTEPVEHHIARRVAINFVNNGLTSWSHLDGLLVSDLVVSNTMPADSALISRAIAAASEAVKSNRARSAMHGSSSDGAKISAFSSADEAALRFNTVAVIKAEQDWIIEAAKLGISGLGISLRPA